MDPSAPIPPLNVPPEPPPLPVPAIPTLPVNPVDYITAYVPPPAPAKPRVWTVFVAFAVAFIPGCIAAGLVAVVLAVAFHGIDVINPETGGQAKFEELLREPAIFLPTLLATQIVLVAVALGAAYFSPVPMKHRLRLGRPRLPWYGYPIVCVGSLALGYTASVLIELLGFGDQGTLKEFERAIAGMRGWVLVAAAAVIGLSPGFGEELLFRGYIQTRLVQRWPRLLAIGVTALLFALLHMDPVQSTFALFMGLWLGEVADRTGSIWPAVAGHAFNNSVATVASALLPGEAEPWFELAVTIPVFALCLVYVLCRRVVPVEPEPSVQVAVLPVAGPYSVSPPV